MNRPAFVKRLISSVPGNWELRWDGLDTFHFHICSPTIGSMLSPFNYSINRHLHSAQHVIVWYYRGARLIVPRFWTSKIEQIGGLWVIEPLSGLLIPRPEYSVNWGATLKAIKMLILLQISDGVGLLDWFRDHGNDEKSVKPEFDLYRVRQQVDVFLLHRK